MMAKSVVEQKPVGTQTSGGNEALDWRIERYLELGFEENEAIALANSTEASTTGGKDQNSKKLVWHTPLHWSRVKKALDGGCSKTQALDIFVNAEAA
jgi:hypothetical protein